MSETRQKWPGCDFAGDVRHPGTAAGVEVYVRRCDWRGDVGPKTCGTCPVLRDRPDAKLWRRCGRNLVDAVKFNGRCWEAMGSLEAFLRAHGISVEPFRNEKGQTIAEVNRAALAATEGLVIPEQDADELLLGVVKEVAKLTDERIAISASGATQIERLITLEALFDRIQWKAADALWALRRRATGEAPHILGKCPYVYGRDPAGKVTACMVHLGCPFNGDNSDCPYYLREQLARRTRAEAAWAELEARLAQKGDKIE